MNVSVSVDFFIEEIAIAENSLSKKAEFMTKYCNIKQNSSVAWLDYVTVDKASKSNCTLDDFRNTYCVGGIDLSQTTDLTACCVVIEKDDEDESNLTFQEEKYAKDYLKSIGRSAQILKYKDFDHILLTDRGVSVEVSNKIPGKELPNYPYWIGKCEKIENGMRVVYEMIYNQNDKYIVFKKYEYESKNELEFIKYNAQTGERY